MVCPDTVEVFDLESLKALDSIATPHKKNALPRELAFDSQEKRGFLSYSGDDRISLLDLLELKMTGSIDMVSSWSTFAAGLASAAIAGAAGGVASGVTGAPVFVPLTSFPSSPAVSTMVVDSDDEILHVLGLSEVFFIDLLANKKVGTLTLKSITPVSARFLPNGLLAVNGVGPVGMLAVTPKMVLVNSKTRKLAAEQHWFGEGQYSADKLVAVNYDSDNVYCMDAGTMSILKTIKGFKELRQMVLADSSANVR